MTIRSALTALGTTMVALAAALLLLPRHDHEVWLVLAVGIGVIAFSTIPRRVASARRPTAAIVASLVVGFVALRAAQVVARGTSASALLALGAEILILSSLLLLLRAHFYGIGRLVESLSQPPPELGYARILRVDEASGVIESELARSRRRNEPLFLVEFASRDWRDVEGPSAREYGGPSSIRYLERIYVQARLGVLLAQHARRSDVVICERSGRYLVLSADTDADGALAMSNRVVQAVHSQLDMTVAVGIASFPADGQSFRDLLAVASDRCTMAFESTTAPVTLSVVDPTAPSSMARQQVVRP